MFWLSVTVYTIDWSGFVLLLILDGSRGGLTHSEKTLGNSRDAP